MTDPHTTARDETIATAATVTVERHDLNAAWSIIVVYASRVRDDDARAHADALAARLRAILEATDGGT